jgi:hypothetical protein
MDGLEHALEQLRAHDTRPTPARLRSLRRRLNLIDTAIVDQRAHRVAAAYAVVDALAVLAGAGGLASDVRDVIGERGHIHEWGSDYRSCSCGQRPPADDHAVRSARTGQPIYPATVHDTIDHPDPYLGPAAALDDVTNRVFARPDPYRDPAFVDAEYTEDD